MEMRLEIDIPEHHYNNIMAIDSMNLGRAPYKGIIMYAINAIKRGRVLEQDPNCSEIPTSSFDCISRERAIEEADKLCLETGYDNEKVEEMLRDLPPVTPQPRKGHWIESDYGNMITQHRWYCSECGGMHNDPESGEWREVFDFKYDYCPLCGADMKEVEE